MNQQVNGGFVPTEEQKAAFEQWALDLNETLDFPVDPIERGGMEGYLLGFLAGAEEGLHKAAREAGCDTLPEKLVEMVAVLHTRRKQILQG
ncbi:hypothetical protein NFI00_000193 [Salmonella enterica]|nr:hypothetical protein [Salmonella enterica]